MNKILDWVEMNFVKAIVLGVVTVVLILTAILVSVARAGDVAASWTQPTTNVDGSTIPATGAGRLVGNRLEWGTCSGSLFGTAAGQQVFATPTTSYTVTALPPGTHCFRVYASTTYGESAPSAVVSKVITPPLPNPPTFVTITTTAHTYRQTKTGLRLVRSFYVPKGVTCGKVIGKIDGKPYRVVSPSKVSGSNPGPFVTRCAAA